MTCGEFEMDPHDCIYRNHEIEWHIKVRDGDIKIEFSVYDECIQDAIKDNFDYVIDTVGKEITERVFSMNDLGQITDEEKAVFNKIMMMVIE